MRPNHHPKYVAARVTPHEAFLVKRAAELMQMTVADLIRECVFQQARSIIETYDPLPSTERD